MENAAAKRPLFTEAFSLFRPEDGALRALIDGARVEKMQILRASRRICASVSFVRSPGDEALAALEQAVAAAYGLADVVLVENHEGLLPDDGRRAAAYLKRRHPSINGFFSDCVLSEEV